MLSQQALGDLGAAASALRSDLGMVGTEAVIDDGPVGRRVPLLPRVFDPGTVGSEPACGRLNLPPGARMPTAAMMDIDRAGRRARAAWFAVAQA
jgi:hypothetical protein